MPEAILIGPLVIQATVIITVVSLGLGVGFFWFTSPFETHLKKRHLNYLVDLIITFIIAMIISKMILHIELVFTDPIAVLAYPSDSRAFYMATAVLFIFIYRHIKQGNYNGGEFLNTSVRFILSAHFFSLFGSLILTTQYVSIVQLSIHLLLLMAIVIWPKVFDHHFMAVIVIVWGLGQAFASLFDTMVLFGFYVSSIYYVLIGLIGLVYIYVVKRKL
ncbi:hypothetical protein SAMN05421734_106139 [Pelagirhabdus alkalitolerans]|uniref:Uncharacterized protein n=1 Tax=Pelagirhabdus alkalitolerans TaxID=1612202 RepID=A0A1G6KMP5_9BACI|nr:hypothetical protein [Pelagirhabdus alkalitolerans]SDC32098.1 hypothetical protein SAMN05421734_106139 [Pelagirhabdus alkalitolerans]